MKNHTFLKLELNPLAGVILNNTVDRITLLEDSNPLAGVIHRGDDYNENCD